MRLFYFSLERRYGMLENKFQADLIKEIEHRFKGCIVLHNDANYIQGFPDLTILYKQKWAVLECKKAASSRYQANQEYYIENRNDYDGVIFSYSQAFEFARKRNDLNISLDFGNELISFPVNKNKKEFLQDINLLLLELRDSLELQKICQQNYGDIPFVPVCSLT